MSEGLIEKYKELYSKLKDLANDSEIFPDLTESQFKEFVSTKDWMGIPSFSISKKEMTNSDQSHLAISLRDGIFWTSVWFNGKNAVERFTNILSPIHKNERAQLKDFLQKLDDKYYIEVNYTEKFFSAGADWKPVLKINCSNLSEEQINNLLESINKTKEKREARQKEIPKSQIATLSVSLAEVNLQNPSDEVLKEVLGNLIALLKITHSLKTSKQINTLEKDKNILHELLKRKIKLYEEGLDEESSEEDYLRWIKRIETGE